MTSFDYHLSDADRRALFARFYGEDTPELLERVLPFLPESYQLG